MSENLTPRQKRFCEEYVIDLNATQSAIRAGYSEKGARQQGSQLLSNTNIQAYLKELMDKKESELIAEQDEILESLTRQGRRQEKDYQIVVLKEKVIENGVVTETEEVKVVDLPTRNNDAIRAWELLGKRYALWTDKVDQTNRNIEIEVGEWEDED